nr:PD40 domain-containing protein [Chloroflexota bacterium]
MIDLHRKPVYVLLVLTLLVTMLLALVCCQQGTPTPTPTPLPTATNTPIPTNTPTASATPVAMFSHIVFGTELESGVRVKNPGTSFPAGTDTVYAQWSYHNMRHGLPWKYCWYFDNALRSCDSFTWDVYLNAASGDAYTAPFTEPTGLAPGVYRLDLFIEERPVASASFWVLAPTPTPTAIPTATPPPPPDIQAIIRRAALSVVRLEFPALGQGGSASIVDGQQGLLLTNWHVVADDNGRSPEGELVAVFCTLDPDDEPRLSYWAQVLRSASDPVLDLAFLQIVTYEDGQTPIRGSLNLPSIPLGNSEQVRRGDRIILLGYPDYAKDTLSWTEGGVVTFDRDWIKTDALASYGHSGGMAINKQGEQIGVISKVEFVGPGRREQLTLLRPSNRVTELLPRAKIAPRPVWTPQPTPEPGTGRRMVVLGVERLNLRTGPGLDYAVVTEMPLGSVLDVLQAPQWDGARFWYNVRMLSTGLTGWASEFFLAPTEVASAPILFVSDEAGTQDIYRINPDGTGRMRLTSAPGDEADPSWSPDRRRIVFAYRGVGDTDLYIMNADGSGWQQITDFRGDEVHPVWSPNGQWIAYVSNADGDWEIYLLELSTGRTRQLTFNQTWDSFPSWSPDSTQLVYTSRQTGNYDLFLLDVASGRQSQLTNNPYSDAHGTWSPQGNEIVYTMVVAEGGSLTRGIGVLDVRDPTRSRRVTFGETGAAQFAYPDWSPDGRFIIVVVGDAPNFELHAAPARGTTMVKLTSATSQSSIAPTWSR